MKNWKKILICVLSAVMLVAGLAMFACKGGGVTCRFVTYDGQSVQVSGEAGAEVEFPDVTREGYIFKGWYLSEDFSGEEITSATFENDVTYYAKWAVGYAVLFDLDGGSMETSGTLYLEEGARILDAVRDYEPVKGELLFGGWYYEGEELRNERMPQNSVTLTARYLAEYTIDVYLQDLDDKTTDADESLNYTKQAAYVTDYYLVGEDYAPVIAIPGYRFDALRDDKTELNIDSDKTKNVFELYFDREEYTLTTRVNYPDGTSEESEVTYLYEEKFALPGAPDTEVEGYRFFGWATRANATVKDVIKEDPYSLTKNTVLYSVWNKGYTDMFGGNDYIFLNYDEENTAILYRGGVEIAGAYNERKEIYVFEGDDLSLNVKINDNGTFVYYSNRKGAYNLFDNQYVYTNITMSLTDTDECYYSSTEDDNKFYKTGTYTIDENGIYTATFVDQLSGEESILYFTIGSVTATSGTTYQVFMIRGDECDYGVIGLYEDGEFSYPTVTLNGFGYALYETQTGSSYYYYTIKDDIVTLSTTNGTFRVLRVKNYGGVYGYEIYSASFDKQFTNGSATLTLDGCKTAVYEDGNTTITGTFTYQSSLIGRYLVTVTAGNQTYLYLINRDGTTFEEKFGGYAEYYYAGLDGRLSTPYLVITGDGQAALYERDADSVYSVISTGSFVSTGDGYSYRYTVNGAIADWAVTQYTEMTFVIDTTSTNYALYYLLSSKSADEGSVDYTTVYQSAAGTGGATLTLTAYFAIYNDGNGFVFTGLMTQYTDYIRVSNGSVYGYFTLAEEAKTFVVLSNAPMVLNMVDQAGKVQSGYSITVNGTTVAEDQYYAVYAEPAGEDFVRYEGYYTAEAVSGMGKSLYVYTFVSPEKTFKFTVASSSSGYYFYYYELDEAILLGSYTAWTDSEEEDGTSTVTVTDLKTAEGAYLAIYTVGGVEVRCTYTSRVVKSFDLYEVIVYTLTPLDSSVAPVEFTLLGNYFRICKETVEYRSADGSTLILDGVTHIARYTVGGVDYDNYYQVVTNLADGAEIAVAVSINGNYCYFDLNSANKTFALRGAEAGAYEVLKNDQLQGKAFLFDGHGGVKIYSVGSDDFTTGTYTYEGAVYTVVDADGTTYVGELGTYVNGENTYSSFNIRLDVIVGTFLNEGDLSVIILDSVGGATYYGSYGGVETGSYTVVSESLFYFTNSDRSVTKLFRYTYAAGKVGTFAAVGSAATYYASDFSSIVFTSNGVAVIDNSKVYLYENDMDTITLYEFGGENPNAYGFGSSTLKVVDQETSLSINCGGKDYLYFYGGIITLTDSNGNELSFQPTGGATFTVEATYLEKATGTKTTYYIIVNYRDGNVNAVLADNHGVYLNSSIKGYNLTFNYEISFDLVAGTFSLDIDDYICGVTLYDYMYAYYVSYYGSSFSSLFADLYGYVNLIGEPVDGKIVYSLSGGFNYLKDSEGKAVTFENGTLSRAGMYNQNYGNLFVSEFVGSDGETYHMSFYLYQLNSNVSCYIIYALTRVTDSFAMEDGSVVYTEELVYTLFNIPKTTDEEGNVVNFAVGDEFYPSLRYRGELICTEWEDLGDNEWKFTAYTYTIDESGRTYTVANDFYYFNFTLDELTDEIAAGSVTKYSQTYYTAEDGDIVYVMYRADDGAVEEIYRVKIDGYTQSVKECVKNEDGSFTITVDSGVYTVTFTSDTDDDGNKTVTVTIAEVPGNGDESAAA